MLYPPPAGYADCESDADADIERRGTAPPRYHEIAVDEVGVIHARRPLPNAIPNLSGAANAKIAPNARIDHLVRFVQNHLAPGEYEEMSARMMDPDVDMPPDTMLRVSRAIATAGSARPTRRSFSSR